MADQEPWQTEPFSTQGWHPRLVALLECWRALPRGGKRLAPRAAFDAFQIPRMLGSLWLLDIERDPLRLRYRLFGTHIVLAIGADLTGTYLNDMPMSEAGRRTLFARLAVSTEGGLATHARAAPILKHSENWHEIETLMLPFADDGRTPDILLCGSIFYRLDGSVF